MKPGEFVIIMIIWIFLVKLEIQNQKQLEIIGNGYNYENGIKIDTKIQIHIETFRKGWKIKDFRYGKSQNWAKVSSPEGWVVEIYLDHFLDLFVENLLRDINVNNTYHKDIYQDDTIYIITNSDHIMNRLKVAKKEKDITVLEFQFHPFENQPMVKILTDSNGTCSTYPVDFMDEFSNQLLKLI